jgi:hypothetical protein
MVHKQVSLIQIYAWQVLFSFAYFTGVALIAGFIVGAFLFCSWALNFIMIDLFNALSIDTQIGSKVLAFVLIAFSLAKSSKKLKAQLIEYWVMIVKLNPSIAN